MNQRKLLLDDKVEVRQFEKGLRGSWHPGVVVGMADMRRVVEYDELLTETGNAKLIESIVVSKAIEGQHQRRYVAPTYRGHIRPSPPPSHSESCGSQLHFGVCVDVWFEDAWWEGVVLDSDDNANQRVVFFPDEGDARKISVNQLRVSRVWDEFMGNWTDRGVWVLVELIKDLEGGFPSSSYIKKVWSYLRQNYGFVKMIAEWTCGFRNLWSKYYMDVVYDMEVKSSRHNLSNRRIRAFKVRKKGNESKDSQPAQLIPHLSDSLILRNSDDGPNVGSKQKEEERGQLGEPKRKKWSLRSEKKVQHSGHPDIYAATNTPQEKYMTDEASVAEINACVEGEHAANNTSQEKHLADEASVGEINACVEGEHARPPSDSGLNREVHPVSLSTQNQSNKIDFGVEKPIPVTLCKDDTNQVPGDQSRKQMIVTEDSHVQNNQLPAVKKLTKGTHNKKFPNCNRKQKNKTKKISPGDSELKKKQGNLERGLTKSNKTGSKVGMVVSTFNHKLRSRRASLFVITRRKRSNMKRRVSTKFQLFKSDLRCVSKEEKNKLDGTKALDEVSTSCHHPKLPFENYGKNVKLKDMVSYPLKHKRKMFRGIRRDTMCLVCHYGEDLIFCDCCPCSYHLSCIDLKVIPDERWFCPSCCCGLCGSRHCSSDNDQFANVCSQCNRAYHVDCLSKIGRNPSDSFCSDACHKICSHLNGLLGISNPTGVDGLTWTLLRSLKKDCGISRGSRIDACKKLARALRVMHDCFEPVVEPHTKRDLARDVVFSSVSKLKRLDFRGFYVMVLQKGDEFVCVATVRIHGQTAAEMPLIATDFKYRRQGMCRVLMHELEKLLTQIGVNRLVLPAISQLRETWETSFGFSEMPPSERLKLLSYPFLAFQGTVMFQKFLDDSRIRNERKGRRGGPQVLEGSTSTVPHSQEHNAGRDNENRFCGSCYKRKPKTRSFGKENILDCCAEDNVERYEYVYKRRRILANRDSCKGG